MIRKAAILIAFLLSNSITPAFAIEEYNDIEQHWAQEGIMKFSELGILKGSDGKFRPNDNITRGELSVIFDRIMKYNQASPNKFLDLDDNFYTEAILKANYIGVIEGFQNKVRPNDTITREEATLMIAQALNINNTKKTTCFLDNDDISYWALPTIATLSDLGVVQGVGNNEFKPKENITRAAIVKILDNTIEEIYSTKGTYTDKVDGNLIINTPNVTVKDTKISGNIIISEGVAIDKVFFENVKVDGDIIINSTSKDGINFNNCVVDGKIVLNKKNIFVNLRSSTIVNSIETFAKSTIKIDINSMVRKLIANAETNIKCNGKIIKLEVNSDNVTSQIKPDQVTVMENKKDPIITSPQDCDRVINNHRPSSNPSSNSSSNPDSSSCSSSCSNPSSNLDPGSDLSLGSNPDLSSDLNPSSNPDSSSDLNPSSNPDSSSGSNPGSNPDSSSGSNPSSNPDSSLSPTPVKTYNIFFDESCNKAGLLGGDISVNKITARAGEEITILYTLESGYGMEEILMNGNPVMENKFTMPNEDVVISFTVVKKEYRISFDPTSDTTGLVDGAMSTNKETAESNETITVLYDLEPGYVIKEILANGAPISSNKFVMPNENVTISFTIERPLYNISVLKIEEAFKSFEISKTHAAEGEEIIITYEVEFPYHVDYMIFDGKFINGKKFIMPAKDIEISVSTYILH